MGSFRYTIIIPMGRFDANEPVLASLRGNLSASEPVQIIVAQGNHPARQRNAALARAEGDIIVFLDNDCRLGENYWSELAAAFARPGVEIVGGPALLNPDATSTEIIFHTLLSHPLVAGPVAPRYESRGLFRPSSQTELILCNLAALKTIFERIGPLSTDLYPNEENEWLDRAEDAAVGIYYDPDLQVFRPQRATGWEIIRTLVRYGIGRTQQLRVSGWRFTLHQALPLVVFLPLLALIMKSAGLELMIFLWLCLSALVAATCTDSLAFEQRLMAGLIAPAFPFAYACGQVIGLWKPLQSQTKEEADLPQLYDEKGMPLASIL